VTAAVTSPRHRDRLIYNAQSGRYGVDPGESFNINTHTINTHNIGTRTGQFSRTARLDRPSPAPCPHFDAGGGGTTYASLAPSVTVLCVVRPPLPPLLPPSRRDPASAQRNAARSRIIDTDVRRFSAAIDADCRRQVGNTGLRERERERSYVPALPNDEGHARSRITVDGARDSDGLP